MTNEYLELIEKAQNKRLKLTRDQVNNVRSLYKDVAKELNHRIKKSSKGILNERWLKDYKKQFDSDIKELNKLLKVNLEDTMLKSAEISTSVQLDFFNLLDKRYNLGMKDTFTSIFSRVPNEALKELVSGDFYKDGKGVSQRLWGHAIKNGTDIDYIIQKGLVEKRSPYDLAKDLENYIDPTEKQNMDFKKIYPGVGNKKIEYNSFRLAVTSISHAYQLSLKRSCKANPFVEGIQWNTSNSHRRTCELCKSRNGVIYTSDSLPMDHPNGICFFTPVVPQSMEEVGEELNNWVHGARNDKLDKWAKEYGGEFV